MKMLGKNRKNNKSGFTLIEVIAVLVILAVLAAVAIPRYISLIDEARNQALQGGLAAGMSHVSLAYGRMCLQNGVAPTSGQLVTEVTTTPPNSTDYSFTFVAVSGPPAGVNVTATDLKDSSVTGTRLWVMP